MGQSDDDFMAKIDGLRANRALVCQLVGLGGKVRFGMTSAQLRLAICERKIAVLAERGFVKDAKMFIGKHPENKGKGWLSIDEYGDDPDEPITPVVLTRLPRTDD